MDEKPKEKMWLTTKNPAIVFEDNTVGRLKKQLWDASEAEIDKIAERLFFGLAKVAA